MKGKLTQILENLESASVLLAGKKVCAGFDGCIDSVVKVIKSKTEEGESIFFELIDQFGNYISGKKGAGFSLETQELLKKIGGNMPIMANAMGRLCTNVDCIGAFGYPSIAPAFKDIDKNCTLYSYCNPGFTTAMEFLDGKFMLAEMKDLNNSDWDTLKNTIGLTTIKEAFLTSELICLLNWSEMYHSSNIWEGLLQEVFIQEDDRSNKRHFFFDLSDCSTRSPKDVRVAIKLIEKYNIFGKVTLSLNTNEASIICKTLIKEQLPGNINNIGSKLFKTLKIDTLIIHSSRMSQLWDTTGSYSNKPDFISKPLISTGAGDNFNAGFCIGKMLGLDPEISIMLANIVSNIYILNGQSPDLIILKKHVADSLLTFSDTQN